MFQIVQVFDEMVKIHYVGYHRRHDTLVHKCDVQHQTSEIQGTTHNNEEHSRILEDIDEEKIEQYISHVSDAILDTITHVEKAGYLLPGKNIQTKT